MELHKMAICKLVTIVLFPNYLFDMVYLLHRQVTLNNPPELSAKIKLG